MSSKGLRLRFKGEPTEKKKKKSKRSRVEGGLGSDEHQARPPDGNELAWVAVERITDLAGPSFFFQRVKREDEDGNGNGNGNGSKKHYCLALNPALHRVEAHPVQSSFIDERTAETLDLDGAEVVEEEEDVLMQSATPSDVTQVWVSTRVLDTPSLAPRYTLRSSESRFLSSERTGGVGATAEARGPLEEWTLYEAIPGRYCLKSANETLLALDEMAGGKMLVRSDFDVKQEQSPGPSEMWEIRVQWKFREQARKKEEGEKPLRERDVSFKKVKT